MTVQKISQQQNNSIKQPQFKGAVDATMRFLATNQAIGANGVDVAFMVTPRTASDAIRRGPVAGLETGRREASGTVNHTLIGVYGILAGAIVSALMGIDRKFGTKVNDMMAAPETVKILAENKARNMASQLDYLKETFRNMKAFNPNYKLPEKVDKDGYVKLSEEFIDEVANILDKAISDPKINYKKWTIHDTPECIKILTNKITEHTGAQSKYLLESAERDGVKSVTNLPTVLEDIFRLSKAFNKEKVVESFNEQIKNNKNILDNEFVKRFTKFGKYKSLAGFLIASGVGMSIQPLNMYLTRKKTGQDGFVGVEGRTKDASVGFKLLKCATGAGFFAFVLATLKTGLKGFMSKMAFTGFWPTISQLKGIYGITIISRLMSARDKDELREALTKDFLGFLSWLVLGDFVNKMVAEGLDKKLQKPVMNRTKEEKKKGYWGRVFNSSLKTRDEVLIEALAENGIATTKEKDGNIVAKSFKELLKEIDNLPEEAKKLTRKRLRALNKAQVAGYMFSGLVLGLGIPNLNIYITNKLDRKHKAEEAARKAEQAANA